MKLELNPLIYKSPKVFGDFEILDLLLVVFAGVFFPMGLGLLGIPMWLSGIFIWPPIIIYLFKFKSGKPKSYFKHWLRWNARPHYWINSPSKENIYEIFPQIAEEIRISKNKDQDQDQDK